MQKKQVFHINLLKSWRGREGLLITPTEEGMNSVQKMWKRRETGQESKGIGLGSQFTPSQNQQLRKLTQEFSDIFSKIPGKAQGIVHKIVTLEGKYNKRKVPNPLS